VAAESAGSVSPHTSAAAIVNVSLLRVDDAPSSLNLRM
jgi:hypothetical protein